MKPGALLILACLQLFSFGATAGDYIIPSDISVSLTAEKTDGLLPGDVITFRVVASNIGDQPAFPVVLRSSTFVHELVPVLADCDNLTIVVADGEDFFAYYFSWYAAALPGTPPIAAGETRICQLQMVLTSAAPALFSFSFGIPDYITDTNPDNDSATVFLRRGDLQPVTLPVNSRIGMLLLMLGVVVAADMRIRDQVRVKYPST